VDIQILETDLSDVLAHPLVRGLMDSVSDGVLVIGVPDREILAMNRLARDLLGYETREVIGCQCRKMMNSPACSNACPLTAALEARDEGRSLNLYYRGKTAQQMLHAHTRMLLVRGPDGSPVAGIELFRDLSQVTALKKALRERASLHGIIGAAPCMHALFELVEQVAPFDLPVLITGPSGVGKERFADAVQHASSRADKPFVKLSCAALSESLVESTLFGHKRGAFTGASETRRGYFEEADGGTLLLDEIGELPGTTQAKLLRALQQGEIQRLGEDRVRKVDVRIIAATNTPLEEAVRAGRFREDLFYRLAGAHLHIPPLRERKTDIPALARHFLAREAEKSPTAELPRRLGAEAEQVLLSWDWPGNVRELENVLRLAAIKARGLETIQPDDLTLYTLATVSDPEPKTLAALEARAIDEAMRATDGNIAAAARRLGIDRTTLWRKLRQTEKSRDA